MADEPDCSDDDIEAVSVVYEDCMETFDHESGCCTATWHTHCPFCGQIHDCIHELVAWDEENWWGSGSWLNEVEPLAQDDENLYAALDGAEWRACVPLNLQPVIDAYHESDSTASGGLHLEVFQAALVLISAPVEEQRWEMTDTMGPNVGYAWYTQDVVTAQAQLADVWERLRRGMATILQARSEEQDR